MLSAKFRRCQVLRRWLFGLALVSFIALHALSAGHLHATERAEHDCSVCAAVLHHPVDHVPPPLPALLLATRILGVVSIEPADAVFYHSFSRPSSRAPPSA